METTNVKYITLEYTWPYFIHLKLPLKFEVNLKNATWEDIYKLKVNVTDHSPFIKLMAEYDFSRNSATILIHNVQEIYIRQTGIYKYDIQQCHEQFELKFGDDNLILGNLCSSNNTIYMYLYENLEIHN